MIPSWIEDFNIIGYFLFLSIQKYVLRITRVIVIWFQIYHINCDEIEIESGYILWLNLRFIENTIIHDIVKLWMKIGILRKVSKKLLVSIIVFCVFYIRGNSFETWRLKGCCRELLTINIDSFHFEQIKVSIEKTI